ncbi:MAG: peptidoglycan DD-metalloendopeptidase family protein [Bacteroidales bacterium]|nr:peptidoglycan DD-metalloendopeptidase family protein [Bacteroidales bacterium]
MTKRIVIACMLAAMAMAPALSYGQNNNPNKPQKDKKDSEKKSVIKQNKLDVIYYEDDEYSGIVIDRKPITSDDQSTLYTPPRLIAPPPMEDEDYVMHHLYQAVEDEGVESEDDILNASFDPTAVHSPKMDVANWHDTAYIQLVNHRAHQEFAYPTPSYARLTSHYGARRRRWHYGIDLALPTGEPIYASFDGVVRFSDYNNGGYGNLVVVVHNNGLETYYAHLSQRNVHPGDQVKAGDIIGLCGNTGRSYGSHLHYEIRYRGVAMNPEHVIDCTKHDLIKENLTLTAKSFAKVGSAATGNSGGTYTGKGGGSYYKVRQGDTLGKIAKRNGTTVKRLCQLNGIKETTILSVGRRLRIR